MPGIDEALAVAGPILSGIGGVASAFKGSSGPSYSKQAAQEISNYRKSIQWRVQDAKEAGIHPLYALGAGGGVNPVNFMQGQKDAGVAISRTGDAISQAAKALASPTTLEQAQIRAMNTQSDRNTARAAATTSAMILAEQAAGMGRPGSRDNPIPTVNYGIDPRGNVAPYPNQDLLEAGETIGNYQFLKEQYYRFKNSRSKFSSKPFGPRQLKSKYKRPPARLRR